MADNSVDEQKGPDISYRRAGLYLVIIFVSSLLFLILIFFNFPHMNE